jgi:hypothetical protein
MDQRRISCAKREIEKGVYIRLDRLSAVVVFSDLNEISFSPQHDAKDLSIYADLGRGAPETCSGASLVDNCPRSQSNSPGIKK